MGTEPDKGLELTNSEIMTWAKVRRFTNWATQALLGQLFKMRYSYQVSVRERSEQLTLFYKSARVTRISSRIFGSMTLVVKFLSLLTVPRIHTHHCVWQPDSRPPTGIHIFCFFRWWEMDNKLQIWWYFNNLYIPNFRQCRYLESIYHIYQNTPVGRTDLGLSVVH